MRYFKIGDIKISNCGKFLLKSASSVASGSAKKSERTYVDTDGAEYSDIYFEPRIFQIDGHIMAESEHEMNYLKNKLSRALNPKKEIEVEYCNNGKFYKAAALSDALPDYGERIKWVLPFSIYINVFGFYWVGKEQIKENIFKITDNLDDRWTLPMIVSNKTSKSKVYNNGDVETACVFEITCQESGSAVDITLKNNSTEKQIKITRTIAIGEVITIDTENYKITSSTAGNIMASVDSESDFFGIKTGVNEIEAVCAKQITVVCKLNERYIAV